MPKNKMISPSVKSSAAAVRKLTVVRGGQKNKASSNRNKGGK